MPTPDTSILETPAGLVKSSTVTQDSETTVMRSGKDLQDLIKAGCMTSSADQQAKTLRGLSRLTARSSRFNESLPRSEYNTRDGEINDY